MARYLVFPSQGAANAAQDKIFTRLANALVARGHSFDPAKGILGHRASDDAPAADVTQRTTRWAVPRQRLDGKWVILHPEEHSLAKQVPGVAAQLVQDLDAAVVAKSVTVEEYQSSWFPTPKVP